MRTYVIGNVDADGFYTLSMETLMVTVTWTMLTSHSFCKPTLNRLNDPTFNSALDYDADGDVDNVDFSFFLGRYFKTLPF